MLYRILFFGLLAFFFFWGTSRGDSGAKRKLVSTPDRIYLGDHR